MEPSSLPVGLAVLNSAEVGVRFGKHRGATLRVEVTPAGLLAIGALVSSILLSTAAIVLVARRT